MSLLKCPKYLIAIGGFIWILKPGAEILILNNRDTIIKYKVVQTEEKLESYIAILKIYNKDDSKIYAEQINLKKLSGI